MKTDKTTSKVMVFKAGEQVQWGDKVVTFNCAGTYQVSDRSIMHLGESPASSPTSVMEVAEAAPELPPGWRERGRFLENPCGIVTADNDSAGRALAWSLHGRTQAEDASLVAARERVGELEAAISLAADIGQAALEEVRAERDAEGARADVANELLATHDAELRTALTKAEGERDAARGQLRCTVTGNPCGTDTFTIGQPCLCNACLTWEPTK